MSRIYKQGADWLNPAAPMTGWQRERARGAIQPMDYPREPLWKSFAAALCVAAFVTLLVAL